MRIPFSEWLVSDIGYLLYFPLGLSYRFKIFNRDFEENLKKEKRPIIYTFWHNRLVPLVAYYTRFYRKKYPKERIDLLVSRSRDGEIAARALERFHFGTVRGSSARGGKEAFFELVSRVRSGRDTGIVPDGPRGPRYQAKEGAVALAKLTGAAILPLGVSARPVKIFNSWDRLMLPLLFAKVVVIYAEPIFVSKDQDLNNARMQLERSLMDVTLKADKLLGLQLEY